MRNGANIILLVLTQALVISSNLFYEGKLVSLIYPPRKEMGEILEKISNIKKYFSILNILYFGHPIFQRFLKNK